MATAIASQHENAGQLAVYTGVTDAKSFIEFTGNAIAKSQMFGCQTIEQGQVLAMECLAKQLPPLSLAQTYHIIQGNLSMRSDAMLAAFRERGGKHKIIDRTSELAAVKLELDGNSLVSKLSWEEAQQEKYPFGKGGKVKDNWATPRGRMQMLWARVVSDGVRALCPEVVSGTYTPEELGSQVVESEQVASQQPANGKSKSDDATDVPFSVVSPDANEQAAQQSQQPAQQPPMSAPSTPDQREKIKQLCEQLPDGAVDLRQDMADIGVQALTQLSALDAFRMIDKYMGLLKAVQSAAKAEEAAERVNAETAKPSTQQATQQTTQEVAGTSQVNENATEWPADGLIDQVTIDEINGMVKELLPYEGESYKEKIVAAIAKLANKPNAKLADLSIPAAIKLKELLSKKLLGRRLQS